ncbi:MAG: hypothetical protein K1X61_10095 [Chitinophagales bacterium]|nr:hypothetical protein [Chitinophagales bacterium]
MTLRYSGVRCLLPSDYKKSIIFFSLLFLLTCRFSFAQAGKDSIETARQLRDEMKLRKATDLLHAYHQHHPEDINALWLLAQTTYWRHQYKRSVQLYDAALQLQPDKELLQLDYARSLIGMEEWEKADSILGLSESRNHYYSDGLLLRSRIFFHLGNYDAAKEYSEKALISYNQNTEAQLLLMDIKRAMSPWLLFNTGFGWDDQPLQTFSPGAESGFHVNALLSPSITVYAPVFFFHDSTQAALLLSAGNLFVFKQIGLSLKGDLGIVKFPSGNQSDWTGSLAAQEIFAKHVQADFRLEHKPYFHTIASQQSNISQTHLAFSIGWNDQQSWNGSAGIDAGIFPDDNSVSSVYGWLFCPPVRLAAVELRAGYAFNFSNSRESRFAPGETYEEFLNHYATDSTVKGVYDPYFTPLNQQIHAALLSFISHPSASFSAGLNLQLGIFAHADAPYLYLQSTDTGTELTTGYAKNTRYTPLEVSASCTYQASDKIALGASYLYRHTFFYNSQYAGFTLKISCWNDKKG